MARIRRKADRKGAQPRPPARDPLRSVPELLPDIEIRYHDDGRAQVRRPVVKGDSVMRWFASKLGFVRDRFFNLDEVGTAFIRQIDGKRRLRAIAAEIGEQFAMEPEDANHAVVEYTQLLMLRGIVGVRPEGTKSAGAG